MRSTTTGRDTTTSLRTKHRNKLDEALIASMMIREHYFVVKYMISPSPPSPCVTVGILPVASAPLGHRT
jgi:hypothetical protein